LRIVRPSVIYGPHNRGNVYNLVRQALGWSFVFVGPRSVVKSIAFVENMAGFLLHVLEHDARDTVFNYCDEPALSTWDMVQLVRRLGAVRGPLVGVPATPSLLAARVLDRGPRSLRDRFGSMKIEKFMRPTRLSRARATATGYVQRVAMEEALRRTVAWVRSADGRARTRAPARP
jgi:nucleoside-diphosphate-sugar epimerase